MPVFTLHATITIGDHDYPVHDREIPPLWHEFAEEKGFEITGRVRDKNHLVLRHIECGQQMVSKVFTLRSTLPTCPHCLQRKRRDLCRDAGVTWLGASHRSHYLRIRLACGHETERQSELLERVRQGRTGIRCDECVGERLKAEAAARDWALIGADPDGRQGYRLYRHDCGHVQRVAIANMATGRFTCGGCSEGWTRDRSFIYAMRFVLKDGSEAIKVGFSRDPRSRLRHQLITDRDQYAMLIRSIEIPTGRDAIRLEKELHLTLRRLHPEAVLDRSVFAGQVNVVSELYDAEIEAVIMALLDALEVKVRALAARRARRAAAETKAVTASPPRKQRSRRRRTRRRTGRKPRR